MKVRIDKAALTVPLYRAQGVVDRKATTNVIACVHVSAGDDGLVLSATDYDVTMTASVAAEVLEPGAVLVNGRALFEVVRALPEGSVVELTGEPNHRLRIVAGRATYHLNGLDPAEFPGGSIEAQPRLGLYCDKGHIEAMLRRTLFSVSQDDTRPALNGVLLEIEPVAEGQVLIRMVSTDGHRLSKSERTVACSSHDGSSHRCIVHRRGATELQRILEGSDPSVHIGFSGRNVVFASDKARLQVKQIDETFPDYGRVIPEKGDISVSLPLPELVGAIRRVGAVSASKDATLRFELTDGRIVLEMNHQDLGDAHEEIEPASYKGGHQKVGFNPRYLLDVCQVLATDNVSLELSDQFSPCLVHSEEDPGSVFVIMPMRL